MLYGVAFALALALHWLVPLVELSRLPARLAGAAGLVAGGLLARWGEQLMRQAGTNVRPDHPTLALVTEGPFRFSRNPLYLGLTPLYIGLALLVPAVWPLLLLVPVLGIMRWGVIAREERYLERKFGETYRTYARRARRWL